jgi:hypothetical protein
MPLFFAEEKESCDPNLLFVKNIIPHNLIPPA